MREYITLGPTPCEEDCAQVGSPNYHEQSTKECKRYITLLQKKFQPATLNNAFNRKSFPHDFGTYHEVVVWYDTNDEESIKFAFHVESNLPLTWED